MTIIDDIYKAWKERSLNFQKLAKELSNETNCKLTSEDVAYVIFTRNAPPHIRKRINALDNAYNRLTQQDKPQKQKKRRVGRPRKKRTKNPF